MSDESHGQIDTVMHEDRLFPPNAEFQSKSLINSVDAYQELYDRAAADLPAFWASLAKEELHWFKPFESVMNQDPITLMWWNGLQTEQRMPVTTVWTPIWTRGSEIKRPLSGEGEPGDERTLTYKRTSPRSLQVCKRSQVTWRW